MGLVDDIFASRRSGLALGVAPPTLSLAEGYALQDLLAARSGPVRGWKVGATSAGARAVLGVDAPIYGCVFAAPITGAIAAGPRALEAEPEIIIEVGPDLAPARAWVGLEIVRPSRDDALALGAGFIVADNAAHVALVLGTELALDSLDAPRVTLFLGDAAVGEGAAAAVDGGPAASVAWLVAVRAGFGRPVRAGDLVATGAMARAVRAGPGNTVRADFGVYGSAQVRIV